MKTQNKTVYTFYEQKAIDFLNSTDTTIEIVFDKNDYHFTWDKDKRDIYNATIKRGNRKFSFKFGNSLNDSGFYYTKVKQKTDLDRKFLDKKLFNDLGLYIKNKIDWSFLNNGKSDFIHYPKEPTAYGVLACLQKYDVGTFENFCGDFGYDEDSRTAEKTYKAVVKEFDNVCKIWTDEEIEQLQEIN